MIESPSRPKPQPDRTWELKRKILQPTYIHEALWELAGWITRSLEQGDWPIHERTKPR